ncbi:hypothetical protein E3N88_40728 [Mikania micrantha]|uniref:Uncharacterized protein n=1 Tax=Mikania micrantha TaxID=192012 RepID=A0A5N6LPF4_9ASTR|nr:hypothetical protein E3N88_40728 [Mikania micrantha]
MKAYWAANPVNAGNTKCLEQTLQVDEKCCLQTTRSTARTDVQVKLPTILTSTKTEKMQYEAGKVKKKKDGALLPWKGRSKKELKNLRRRHPVIASISETKRQKQKAVCSSNIVLAHQCFTGEATSVIILRRHIVDSGNGGGFEMYYDAGGEAGLSLVSVSILSSLSGLGFNRLLEQLTQIQSNRLGIIEHNSSASKAAIEALPTIMIQEAHVSKQSHCGRR